jgi:hypothetical protein
MVLWKAAITIATVTMHVRYTAIFVSLTIPFWMMAPEALFYLETGAALQNIDQK